jgi:ubiquitin-conjugating enzyme E2 Z
MPLNITKMSSMTKEAKKRIYCDTKDIIMNPLTDMGIYYKNDEENLSIGHALIIGPEDTPYRFGYYLFEFKYPDNYPYSPPEVTYLTNDGKTRFNPNLYKNGKVCLSLLNTWQGPSWKPCQTLRSILISILSNVFVDNPIGNEPSFNKASCENMPYNESIRFKNIEFACLSLYLKKNNINHKAYDVFYPIIQAHFQESFEKINEHLINSYETFNKNKNDLINNKYYSDATRTIKLSLYSMATQISYDTLIETFCDVKI